MLLRFWGTRGTIATPGPSTIRYGGNTSCVELLTNAGRRFIFDCGTGARLLGGYLMGNAPKPAEFTILLSHTHWDYIQGFPFLPLCLSCVTGLPSAVQKAETPPSRRCSPARWSTPTSLST